jgi:hypothetical protein
MTAATAHRRPSRWHALFGLALRVALPLVTASPVSAAPIAAAPTVYCGDPTTDPSMDTGAGTMITCDTQVDNTISAIDPGTGIASGTSVVTVRECTGPASGRLDPAFLPCTTDTHDLADLARTSSSAMASATGAATSWSAGSMSATPLSASIPEASAPPPFGNAPVSRHP